MYLQVRQFQRQQLLLRQTRQINSQVQIRQLQLHHVQLHHVQLLNLLLLNPQSFARAGRQR